MNVNKYRLREVEKVCEVMKNPFNTKKENLAIDSVKNIARYCEESKCENCKIKNLIFCEGKTSKFSPYMYMTMLNINQLVEDLPETKRSRDLLIREQERKHKNYLKLKAEKELKDKQVFESEVVQNEFIL